MCLLNQAAICPKGFDDVQAVWHKGIARELPADYGGEWTSGKFRLTVPVAGLLHYLGLAK